MLFNEKEKRCFDHADSEGKHGYIELQCFLEKDDIPPNAGRGFFRVTILPGHALKSSHKGEIEVFHVESGIGRYCMNGVETKDIAPGNVLYCPDGEYHQITCTGDKPLVMIGIILFTNNHDKIK